MSTHGLTGEIILREVYDATNTALKTVPSAATTFSIELDAADGDSVQVQSMAVDATTIFNAVTAAANLDSSGQNILNYKGFGLLVSWASLDQTDATINIQASIDNIIYTTVESTINLDSASGGIVVNVKDAYYKYFRLHYLKGTNTTGTVTAKYVAKG